MRHLFLAFLIALLPLRGWVGDVMAAQMSTAALAQAEAMDRMMDAMDAAMVHHADCPDHTAMPQDAAADPDAGNSDDPHCTHCTVCQLCHSPAMVVDLARLPIMATVVPPQTEPRVYTDALRVPGFKPPIA
jgi:hypothetical protein